MRIQEIILNKKKRRERDRKLLLLGIILEITDLFIYEQEVILGHLFNFKKVAPIIYPKLKETGAKILKKLDNHDNDIVLGLSTDEKKARNHKLITYGALFEIAGLTNINLAILIGYAEQLHTENQYYFTRCYQDGKIYFLKKKEK